MWRIKCGGARVSQPLTFLWLCLQDILQNRLAGILLLVSRSFRRGDHIVVKDFEGTVEHTQSRATLIKTYDGRRVILPVPT